jgi:hypothetical protein
MMPLPDQPKTVRLAVCIVHDRRRAELLPPLLEELRRQAPRRVVESLSLPTSTAVVDIKVYDQGTEATPWQGMKAALADVTLANVASAPPGLAPTHMLILEDDAVCAPGSLWACVRAATARPMDVLYMAGTADQIAPAIDIADLTYAVGSKRPAWCYVSDRCVGALAVILPVATARRFLNWATTPGFDEWFAREQPLSAGDGDARLAHYLLEVVGVPQICSVFSVFGHGCPEPQQSLVRPEALRWARRSYRPVADMPRIGEVAQPRDVEYQPPPVSTSIWFSTGSAVDARTRLNLPAPGTPTPGTPAPAPAARVFAAAEATA